MEFLINLKNVSAGYGEHCVLRNLTFSLFPNEIAALIGLSGAGKSTLFRLITGSLRARQGQVELCTSGCVSYMTQEGLLLPWRTVLKNLLLPFELGTCAAPPDVHAMALELLHEVGLEGYENRLPAELSGGMRQRVSLARALLQKSPLILLDEPFGSLDVITREQMYLLICSLQSKHRFSLLLITHDFRDVLSLSERVLLMHEGCIERTWYVAPNSDRSFLEEEMHQALSRCTESMSKKPTAI